MTLGLILSPVSGSMTRSYADEVSIEEIRTKAYKKAGKIKNYAKYYEDFKNSNDYRLAESVKKDALGKAIGDAVSYVDAGSVTLEDLDKHIKNIEDCFTAVSTNANKNLNDIKTSILASKRLLSNNEAKKGTSEYEKVSENIAKAIEILKAENISGTDFNKLSDANNELVDSFDKAITAFKDTSSYGGPEDQDFTKLDAELNKESVKIASFEKLLEDRQSLLDTGSTFKSTPDYKNLSEENKKIYDKAFDELDAITGSTESDENILEKVRSFGQILSDVKNENITLNSGVIVPRLENEKAAKAKEVEVWKKHFADKANINKIISEKGLGDKDLFKEYNDAFYKAMEISLDKTYSKDLKDYQNLTAKLNELSGKIKAYKSTEEKPVKSTKLTDLKAAVVKANEFKNKPAYKDADKGLKDKLDKAIKDAVDLVEKEEKNPGSVADKELEDAKKAVDNALDDFNKFADKDSAKKALNALLNETQGINIDQFYGKDQKEARDAYTKAREAAAKAVKNIDKTSLEDLNKIHKDFKENIDKLAEFLNKRLKDLVDDDDNFRKTDEYKEADKDTNREESIVNYIGLLTEAQEELKKAVPDANRLNILYNKLANARSEITKKISPEKRKLSDAVLDSYVFLKSKEYQKALTGSDKYLKYAAEKYRADLERAKKLLESSKINKDEAKEVLESLNKAKDFIESKIKEKEYLIYEYTKKLNEIKNHKDYKNLNPAIRKRLEDALVLAGKSGDKDEIFRALDEVMNDASIKEFIKKIEAEKNPNVTRDKLLTDLTNLINEDKKLKEGGFKYQKAQKALRDAYDVALKEATDFIRDNKNPSEDEVRAVYQKLLNAKNALDGDKFDELIHALAARFKKEQLKIANPADRKAIADKINALSGENMTMDDALRVEKELDALINPQVATTTTLTPQGGVVTNTRPVSTVTNPGSTVKTGINGIAKVAAVLVVAAIILIFTRKKGDKNETNK